MKFAKVGKKGQITIPRSVLRAASITEDSRVVIEAIAEGAIMNRPAATYPIEIYSDDRVREFEATNALPPALERRVQTYLKKHQQR